ncbi:MAG: hypothetical protein R2712_26440 [Vicinamibacterales bacterium]
MAKLVSRADIATVLRHWQSRALTVAQVHHWAERLFVPGNVDFDDYEGDQEDSVANEVLATLDQLDVNLVVVDDIPIYLEFLGTPVGQFNEGYRRFQTALSSIDYKKRRAALATDPVLRFLLQVSRGPRGVRVEAPCA